MSTPQDCCDNKIVNTFICTVLRTMPGFKYLRHFSSYYYLQMDTLKFSQSCEVIK